MLDLFYKIINNSKFNKYYQQLKEFEKHRIFCKHDIEHSINLAKLCVYYCEKKEIACDIDIIYSAALLHDIGRIYSDNTNNHNIHSAKIAKKILFEIKCTKDKINKIIKLIEKHRNKENIKNFILEETAISNQQDTLSQNKTTVEDLFALADKKSRKCYMCTARDICKWPDKMKNMDKESFIW